MSDPIQGEPPTVAIVGGGCSGVLTAAHLLRSGRPCRIVLADRGPSTGRGAAYANPSPCLLLNVPASGMSAFPDQPDHFARWAGARHGDARPHAFLPRHLYGTYLGEVLDQLERHSAGACTLDRVRADTTAITTAGDGAMLGLRDGTHLQVDKVVLALGNFAPARPPAVGTDLIATRHYVADPWAPAALDGIGAADNVLLVGTGLTAVDVAVLLAGRGHTGAIYAVSRHGLLPQPHAASPSPPRTVTLPAATRGFRTARDLLAAVRAEVRAAERRGDDWRPVVDGLRPVTQQLWRSLPDTERQRFVRLVARYWDVHRHRMAPSVASFVQRLQHSGQLVVTGGGISSLRLTGGRVHTRLGRPPAPGPVVDRVVNCTGPRCDVARVNDPLVRALLARGTARPGALGLGFDVDHDGALVDRAGRVSSTVFAIGPLRKGALWETTAVPEIAAQAGALACLLVRERQREAV